MQENTNIEYKREYTDKIKQVVIAFLNASGGEIFVGIDDGGKIVGLVDIGKEMEKCTNSIKNAITPDAIPFVRVDPIELEGKAVIKITVSEGTKKPYYLTEKGPKPSGVWVRVGNVNVQADETMILRLMRESEDSKFIEGISLEQDLTFRYAEKCFRDKSIAFGPNEMLTLGFVSANGQYTNLALICSDQNPYSIKFSVFQGLDKTTFLDRKEIEGSVFEQLDNAMKTLLIYNKVPATIQGLSRADKPDYSEVTIREALLNAIIHRDYNFSGAILFSLYDDRIEIMSLGGLVKGISKDIILRGVSEPRNKKLADVFYRLRYVESYGTGVPRIFAAYKQEKVQPKIEIFDQGVNVVLPNMNYARANGDSFTEQEMLILDRLASGGSLTKDTAATLIDKKSDTAYRVLEKLVASGHIVSAKVGRKLEYKLKG